MVARIQYDNVKFSVSGAPGTGTITVGSAQTGYLTPSGAGVVNGGTIGYRIDDGSSWEIGSGVYTSSGATIARTPIFSSNANAAITASAASVVSIVTLAEDLNAYVASMTAGSNITLTGSATNPTINASIGSGGTVVAMGTTTLLAGSKTYTLSAAALPTLSAGDIERLSVVVAHTSANNTSLAIVHQSGTAGYEVRYQNNSTIEAYSITGTAVATAMGSAGGGNATGTWAPHMFLEVVVSDTLTSQNTIRFGAVGRSSGGAETVNNAVTLTLAGSWYLGVADDGGNAKVYGATQWHNSVTPY